MTLVEMAPDVPGRFTPGTWTSKPGDARPPHLEDLVAELAEIDRRTPFLGSSGEIAAAMTSRDVWAQVRVDEDEGTVPPPLPGTMVRSGWQACDRYVAWAYVLTRGTGRFPLVMSDWMLCDETGTWWCVWRTLAGRLSYVVITGSDFPYQEC